MRENSFNSAGHPTLNLALTSFPNTFAVSPYSAIFCRRNVQTLNRNYKKINTLRKFVQDSSQKSAVNSLFQKILRVSPFVSRFCGGRYGYGTCNANEINILRKCEEKNVGASTTSQTDGRNTKALDTTGRLSAASGCSTPHSGQSSRALPGPRQGYRSQTFPGSDSRQVAPTDPGRSNCSLL